MTKLYSFKGGTPDGDKIYTTSQVRAIKNAKGGTKYSIELSDA